MEAGNEFWPGFEPGMIPLAVYDGSNTFLFGHPDPPGGFHEQRDGVYTWHLLEGRHPAVTANSSAMIGDVRTATLLYDEHLAGRAEADLVAIILHEKFHVFQRGRHPGWGPNEADLFLYPAEDGEILVLRRLETESLRRACFESTPESASAWALRAVAIREERFALMDGSARSYERGIEIFEGLATYVQYRASGREYPDIPPGGFAAGDIRERGYQSGLAMALLLDRFMEGWKDSLEAYDGRFLDEMLGKTLSRSSGTGQEFSSEDLIRIEEKAGKDVAFHKKELEELEREFLEREGWRIDINAHPDQPLNLMGFDPLNVSRVERGILHARYLKLGNRCGGLEIMSGEALSEPAGKHPLFDGVSRVLMTGLAAEPELAIEEDGSVTIRSGPMNASFAGADIDKTGKRISIKLAGPESKR
jgi:hypothetical protein